MKVQPLNPNIRIVDVNTGTLTREGFTFFQALRAQIAGDDAGTVSVEDLELFSMPQMPIASEPFDELPQVSMAAEIAALHARIDELEARAYRP